MVQTWESYISKVHNAVPLDPSVTNVELLDIFAETDRSWLPWQSYNRITRIGSLLNLGLRDAPGWKENVEDRIRVGLHSLENGSSPSNEANQAMFKVESMADMQASLKSSTSFLASITGKAGEAQFDLKGAKTLKCTVTSVTCHRVVLDTLMDLVNQRRANETPAWQPNMSRPEFRWSSKRGKTIWVVTEIMYANGIKIEADTSANAGASAKPTATTEGVIGNVDVTAQMTLERDGVWVVTAAKEKPFSFAFRAKKLEYDGKGILKGKPVLKKSMSLSKPVKNLAAADMNGLYRSASTSKSLLAS